MQHFIQTSSVLHEKARACIRALLSTFHTWERTRESTRLLFGRFVCTNNMLTRTLFLAPPVSLLSLISSNRVHYTGIWLIIQVQPIHCVQPINTVCPPSLCPRLVGCQLELEIRTIFRKVLLLVCMMRLADELLARAPSHGT